MALSKMYSASATRFPRKSTVFLEVRMAGAGGGITTAGAGFGLTMGSGFCPSSDSMSWSWTVIFMMPKRTLKLPSASGIVKTSAVCPNLGIRTRSPTFGINPGLGLGGGAGSYFWAI